MTSAEAREILAAWRSGLPGTTPLDVEQALELARHDSQLGSWWQAQESFHRTALEALRAPGPPPGLADRILAARKVHRPSFVRSTPAIPWWIGIAAALVAVGGVWFAFRGRGMDDDGFEVFRSRMVRAVLREYRMDVTTNDLTAIRGFLARHEAPADFDLSPPLASAAPLGAGLLSWQGRPVSMVCLDGGKLGTLFMFVAPAETLHHDVPGEPRFEQVNRLATVSWSRGNRTYVLAAVADLAELRRWFASTLPEHASLDLRRPLLIADHCRYPLPPDTGETAPGS